MANASPMTSIAVVLLVGARLNGQASLEIFTLNARSLCLASDDFRFPVKVIILTKNLLSAGSRFTNSSDSPE